MTKSYLITCAKQAIVNPVEDGVLQYMPGGIHTITPSQNGRAVNVTVLIDEQTARALETQRALLTSKGAKPFFSPSHEESMAVFWPNKFFWDTRVDPTGSLVSGVWASGEWTNTGKNYVEGKEFRTFSPSFHVEDIRNDPENPVRVICCEDAKANMGALVNDPAFQNISPLWAKNAKTISHLGGGSKAGEIGTNKPTKEHRMNKPTKAELQARNEKLELQCNALSGKSDTGSLEVTRAARTEIELNNVKLELIAKDEIIEADKAARVSALNTRIDAAIGRMTSGKTKTTVPALEKEKIQYWRNQFNASPDLIEEIAPENWVDAAKAKSKPEGEVTPRGEADAYTSISGGWDTKKAMSIYRELVCRNSRISVGHPDFASRQEAYKTKGMLAIDAANFYRENLKPNEAKWEHIPFSKLGELSGVAVDAARGARLDAADYSDPNNNLGLFTGTLVLQRTLPFFAYDYPELRAFFTDFADTPGLLNQTENTRIVLQPAVQKFNATLGADGRPIGWSVISPAKTTNVSLTLTDYISVPINFGNDLLGSTARRLFDEQAVLAVKAIAGYFTNMITDLMTTAKFNAYAVQSAAGANPNLVPQAWPSYVPPQGKIIMQDLDAIKAAFTSNKVPLQDRGVLLNPQAYAYLRADPRLSFYFAASMAGGGNDFVTKGKLTEIAGFMPYEAPYLPGSTPTVNPTTNNLIGFAFQKAGIILKARLPNDFTAQLGAPIPGLVTTVTDPDTKISLMLVQYVNLPQNYAEWRPEVQLGVAVGDNRGGLCITSS